MAELNTIIVPDGRSDNYFRIEGQRHIRLVVESFDDGDTYTLPSGNDAGISVAALEVAATQLCDVTTTRKVVTFHATSAGSAGILHLWMNG